MNTLRNVVLHTYSVLGACFLLGSISVNAANNEPTFEYTKSALEKMYLRSEDTFDYRLSISSQGDIEIYHVGNGKGGFWATDSEYRTKFNIKDVSISRSRQQSDNLEFKCIIPQCISKSSRLFPKSKDKKDSHEIVNTTNHWFPHYGEKAEKALLHLQRLMGGPVQEMPF